MKFALVLSGCGQHDGSETHEVILTLLSLAQQGINWDAFAPDIVQHHVTNHLTDSAQPDENRQVLVESARLTRGHIQVISQADLSQYDAIILPGGAGAISNLCNWYDEGVNFSFEPSVKSFLDKAVQKQLPMGFICIAPMMIPKLFHNANLTIGNDKSLAQQIHDLGCHHIECQADDIVTDSNHRIVSTPANMVAQDINEVHEGIFKLVKKLSELR